MMNPDIDVYITHVKIWQKKSYHASLGLKRYLPRDRVFLKICRLQGIWCFPLECSDGHWEGEETYYLHGLYYMYAAIL